MNKLPMGLNSHWYRGSTEMWLERKVMLPQRISIESLRHVVKTMAMFSLSASGQCNLALLQKDLISSVPSD